MTKERIGSVANLATNSIVHRGKFSAVQPASQIEPGLMTKEDYCKLEDLVIPPPSISLTSNECGTKIIGGVISFISGDQYVKVQSFVDIKQNEDGSAPPTYESIPLKIHDNTYGIRFSLDVDRLSALLNSEGRLKSKGSIGEAGPVGDQGPVGDNFILSGPVGDKGPDGNIAQVINTLQTEDITTVNVGATAITNIAPVMNDDGGYDIVITRQPIGNPDVSTNKLGTSGTPSWWAVAINGPGVDRRPFYVNLEGIINPIGNRATRYANTIKVGYEDAVKFWIKTMNDLFDAQKAALCCALERCESKKKNVALRQHWEVTAATAKPEYRSFLRKKDGPSTQGPGTGLRDDIYTDEKFCGQGPDDFPDPEPIPDPDPGGGGGGGGDPDPTNPCVANFVFAITDPAAGLVDFTDTSANIKAGQTTFTWTFGDGSGASTRNPNHRYAADGDYPVTLNIVNSSDGCNENVSKTVSLAGVGGGGGGGGGGDPTCSADFTFNIDEGSVVFSDASSNITVATTTFIWDFGDGSDESQIRNPTHDYEENGNFQVKLTILDSGNDCSASIIKTVVISGGSGGGGGGGGSTHPLAQQGFGRKYSEACINDKHVYESYLAPKTNNVSIDILLVTPSDSINASAVNGVNSNSKRTPINRFGDPITEFINHVAEIDDLDNTVRDTNINFLKYNETSVLRSTFKPVSGSYAFIRGTSADNIPARTGGQYANIADAVRTGADVLAAGSGSLKIMIVLANTYNEGGTLAMQEAAQYANGKNVRIIAVSISTGSTKIVDPDDEDVVNGMRLLAGLTKGFLLLTDLSANFWPEINNVLTRMIPVFNIAGCTSKPRFKIYQDNALGNNLDTPCHFSPEVLFIVDGRYSMNCATVDLARHSALLRESFNNSFILSAFNKPIKYSYRVWSGGTSASYSSSVLNFIEGADQYISTRFNPKVNNLASTFVNYIAQEMNMSWNNASGVQTSRYVFVVTDKPLSFGGALSRRVNSLTAIAQAAVAYDAALILIHVDSRKSISNGANNINLVTANAACWQEAAEEMNDLGDRWDTRATPGFIYMRAAPHLSTGTLSKAIINDVLPRLCYASSGGTPPIQQSLDAQSLEESHEESLEALAEPEPTEPEPAPVELLPDDNPTAVRIAVDVVNNSHVPTKGVKIDAPNGKYMINIVYTDSYIDGGYWAPLRVSFKKGMSTKTTDFVDRGMFPNNDESLNAYVNSAIMIAHGGGYIKLFVPHENLSNNTGKITVEIVPQTMILVRSEIEAIKSLGTSAVEIAGTLVPISLDNDPGTPKVLFELEGNLLVPTKHS